jgi:hypothetical protein
MYREGDRKLVGEVEKIICDSAQLIASEIGLDLIDSIGVVIAPDSEAFRRLHGKSLPEWGVAFGNPEKMLIGLDASRIIRSQRPIRTVVLHEISHLVFFQRVGRVRCPFWFLEGVAMKQSGEWTVGSQWSLALSVWRKELPDLEDLYGPFPRLSDRAGMAYLLSYAAIDELTGENPGILITFTAFLRDTRDFDRAFRLTFGESVEGFISRFHLSLESRYRKTGLLIHSSPYWLPLAVLFILAYIIRRGRNRRIVESWEDHDI